MAKDKDSDAATKSDKDAAKRILLVDDDNEIIEAMRYALETKGYHILVARDGNQGLAMAEREDPDLVILDMMMPKRSGFPGTTAHRPQVPIIVISTSPGHTA